MNLKIDHFYLQNRVVSLTFIVCALCHLFLSLVGIVPVGLTFPSSYIGLHIKHTVFSSLKPVIRWHEDV